jgi:hypothetical protein
VVDVEKVGRSPVRYQITFGDLEAHPRRVHVVLARVVHREDDTLEILEFANERVAQVGGEGRDAALARHIIAEHPHLADRSLAVVRVDDVLRSNKRSRTRNTREYSRSTTGPRRAALWHAAIESVIVVGPFGGEVNAYPSVAKCPVRRVRTTFERVPSNTPSHILLASYPRAI